MTNVSEPAALGGPSARRGGRRRLVFILLAIIAVIAVVLGGGALAYAKQFEGRALPGTTILGQDVAGQTPEEIAALVSDRAESVTVSVTAGDEEHEVSLADLGVTVDAAASGQAAVARDDSLGSVISSTWSGEHPVDPVVEVDEQAVSDYATSLVPEDRTDPVDAEVVFDEEEQSWTAVEARNGQGVDPTTLVDQVTEHAPALESFEVEQPVKEIAPAITTEEAEEVVDSITSLLEQPMSITSADGEVHDVSAERRSGWLSVGPDESGQSLTITVDEEGVREWVATRAEQDTVEPKDGIEQIDDEGEVVKVVSEKRDGVEITNADAVADELIDSLKGTSPLEAAFESRTVESTTEQVEAPEEEDADDAEDGEDADGEDADGEDADSEEDADGEDEAPPAEPTGEKWIDVDLSAKTVTAYVGDTPVWGPRPMVDGKPGNETVTGTYEIYLRYEKQDMTNEATYPEGHEKHYYNPDVPWVQYFHRGYGFHGAPWRSSFGYSGSHGCINMPVHEAKWLYDWASMGTRVEVHH